MARFIEQESWRVIPYMYSTHRYSEGYIFFQEGSSGTSAHIIKSGQVEIFQEQGNKSVVLATFGPGKIFGEMALLGAQTRTASPRAATRTEVITLSRARLLSLLRTGDPIFKHLVLTLVNRFKRTNLLIRPEKPDDFGASACRILALIADQQFGSDDEVGEAIFSYSEAVEQIRAILSIDASDCRALLEKLEAVNLIEIIDDRSPTNKSIRLIDAENFLEKAGRLSKELEAVIIDRLSQRSVYIDLYDLHEEIEVEQEKICKKIGEGAVPIELFFFKKDDILDWAKEVGPSFFEETEKRISSPDDVDSLDAIIHIKNAILREALAKMDFYKTCQLLKTGSEKAQEKILANLPGRYKQVVQQELDLIEEVDPDEVEETTEDLLEEVRDLMAAEEKSKGKRKKGEEEDTDEAEQSEEEDVE